MYDAEGQISIPLEEFWAFVAKYHDLNGAEILYGVPRVDDKYHLVIDYAASTECHPSSWAVKPKVASQWEELEKKQK